MVETPDREQIRKRKEDIRMAMEVAGYVGDLGIKIVPGNSWTLYYRDPGQRDSILQQVLEGKIKPEAVDQRILRPIGLSYDAKEVHTLGLEGLVGKVKDMANMYTSFDYSGYLQYLSSLQGKDISLEDATHLFSSIAANRSQAELIRKLGPTGRGQVREALKRNHDSTLSTIKDEKRTDKLLEVLKARWLKKQGIISQAQLSAVETQVEDEIIKLADNLEDAYMDYVENGTPESKQKLTGAIKGNIDDIKRQQEADRVDEFVDQMLEDPDSLPEDQRQELENMFNDFQGGAQGPAGDMPPDFQGSMSPSMDEMKSGESSDKITPLYTIEPPIKGYYQGTIYNRFNSREVRWECNPSMTKVTSGAAPKQHTLKGKIRNGSTIPLYMPRNYGLAPFTLPAGLEVLKDENGTLYLKNTSGKDQDYSIDFGKEPHPSTKLPVPEEKADMVSGNLSTATQNYIASLAGKSNTEKAKAIIHYMKNVLKLEYSNDSKYNMIYKKNPSEYFREIEKHKQVDCDVAQTYFIALCRKAGVPARMVTGHSVDMVKDGKAIIHSGTGHAWSEIWDEQSSSWKTIDATPEKTKNDEEDKKDPKDKKEPQEDAPEEKNDLDPPPQEPRDDDQPPSPGDVQKKVDDTQDQVQQGDTPPQPPSKTTPQSVKDKMKKMMEQQKPQPGEQQPDGEPNEDEGDQNDLDEAQGEMDEMQRQHEEMKKKAEEMRKKLDEADSLREMEELREQMEQEEMYDDAKDKLEDLLDQKEEEAKDDLREEIQKMKDDGFIDEERAEELLKQLEENNDVQTFEQIEQQLSYESGLYNEYVAIREEIMPLVEQWFEYFADRLPKIQEVDFNEDELTYSGRLDRREYIRPRNLLFGKVNNPPRINAEAAPRFMASLVLDISGSMASRMRDSRKLLIFFAELFQKISEEYGYIMFSISAFDDFVEVIKDFDQKYDSPERYQYGTGQTKTVKVRLMETTMARGGTDMGQAVWDANKHLNEQKNAHPNFLSAMYTISDGETQGQLAGDQLRRFLAGIEQVSGEWWGDHIKCGFMLGPEHHKAILARYFGNKDSIAVPQLEALIEKVMMRFDEDVQDFISRLPDQDD